MIVAPVIRSIPRVASALARAEDCASVGRRVDHVRAAGRLICTHGERHHALVRDAVAGRHPRGPSIGAPPQPLIEGAAVDGLLAEWIYSEALLLAARQV